MQIGRGALWAIATMLLAGIAKADEYTVAEGNASMMVALGCFWCAEQAFEQYAPGVVEVVSGYAGGTIENPTYRNHNGHYEVVLVEYDPTKTSYEVLVQYAYRNMDVFDGAGQFCDKGRSYKPAIFYETEEEFGIAQDVLGEILEQKDWQLEDIAAPILKRPKFWIAEEYHQDYYIKNPANYGYYKNACGRPMRLKELWGLDEYECFHMEEHECFIDPDLLTPMVINADGEAVPVESNIKGAGPETAARLPPWAVPTILGGSVLTIAMIANLIYNRRVKRKDVDVHDI
mmetsp:Transcript_5583/g.13285  ORF Transcript_5583/g.13285 Transcript_5583/m.13285 type:complete len:288 (-) Transcript_5583:159-1022(-)